MKRYLLMCVAVLTACIAFSQAVKNTSAPHTQTIRLIFKNTIGDSVLQTGTTYTNTFGEPFTVRAFKYYISNIQLQYAGSNAYHKASALPHLINEADSTSKQFSFTVPAGTITGIRFLLGVDSIANTAGVQTGDLDPSRGMYWVWNTGYIMAKLEGTSTVAKTPGRQFTYDIGGYKKGEKAVREITLPVPLPISNQTPHVFIIKADVLKWFDGMHELKIAEHPMCHEPGMLAMQIADNYEKMFSVELQ